MKSFSDIEPTGASVYLNEGIQADSVTALPPGRYRIEFTLYYSVPVVAGASAMELLAMVTFGAQPNGSTNAAIQSAVLLGREPMIVTLTADQARKVTVTPNAAAVAKLTAYNAVFRMHRCADQ